VIAKAGKPLVKATALNAPEGEQVKRLEFLAGQISLPDDFDRMGATEMERLFGDGVGAHLINSCEANPHLAQMWLHDLRKGQ
jgi:hypothetical protein